MKEKLILFAKILGAAAAGAFGPELVETIIKALTESGLAATTFGKAAAGLLALLLLYLRSPKSTAGK